MQKTQTKIQKLFGNSNIKDEVFFSKDWDKFSLKKGNRPIDCNHVKNLVKKIKVKDLQVPSMVSDNYEINDGQHRFYAYKECDKPYPFIFRNEITLQDIASLNSTHKKWALKEYLISHTERENPEYKTLTWFIEKYKLTVTNALTIFNGKNLGKEDYNRFRDGLFEIKDLAAAQRIANNINDCAVICNHTKHKNFIVAFTILSQNENFDFKYFKKKFKSCGFILQQPSCIAYRQVLVETYNKRTPEPKKITA